MRAQQRPKPRRPHTHTHTHLTAHLILRYDGSDPLRRARLIYFCALADATVSKDLRLAITQARNAKGLTQKQLATQLNMQPQVINEYESGKAIPNNQVIAKIERALGAVRVCRARAEASSCRRRAHRPLACPDARLRGRVCVLLACAQKLPRAPKK